MAQAATRILGLFLHFIFASLERIKGISAFFFNLTEELRGQVSFIF